MTRKALFFYGFLLTITMVLPAFELDLSLSPLGLIPLDVSEDYRTANGKGHFIYSPGGGAVFQSQFNINNFMSLGPEVSFLLIPGNNTGTSTTAVPYGVGLNTFYYPASRVRIQLSMAGGLSYLTNNTESANAYWWKVATEGGFRFSPTVSLNASAGYIHIADLENRLLDGLLLGLNLHMNLDTRKNQGKVQVELEQSEPVFPLLYGLYRENPVGTLILRNDDSAEIRDIEVYFSAGNYSSSDMLCATHDILHRRETVELPLFADFSDRVMNFTERGEIPGVLTVRYSLLGSDRVTEETLVVPVYNRNTLRWSDASVLASFVSPNAPEVLDYSKYAVGIARNNLRTGLNRNMQFAMYLLEGLKVGGILYSEDDTTPYTSFHRNPEELDYIQYPFQTLAYSSGDYDDLGLLLAGAMESVGIPAALIPLNDDFIVAFSLDLTPSRAEQLFNGTDNLLTTGDSIWIPLSMASLREGFINCWFRGMDQISAAIAQGEFFDLVMLQESWEIYPPSGISGSEAQFQKPLEESLVRAVETDLMRYITTEFGPKIKAVQDEIRVQGGYAELYNKLALLYVRAGLYDEARGEYLKAVGMGSVKAMVNLGNIAYLEKNYQTAKEWYEKALAREPDNSGATRGLNRALVELDV